MADNNNDSDSPSSLFSVRSLQYPSPATSADDESQQRHFVRFTINIDEESKLVKSSKLIAGDADRTKQNRYRKGNVSEDRVMASMAIAGAAIAVGSGVAGAVIKKMQGFSKKGLVGTAIGVVGGAAGALVSDQFNVTKKLKKLAATITLYTPGGITSNHQIGYSQTQDPPQDLLQTDKGLELIQGNSAMGAAGNFASKMTRLLGTASSDILQSLTRTALNPKKDMLFKEVGQRSFQFNYTFAPRNMEEAYDVANIIWMFKYFSHPEMLEGFDQYLYIYPAEFDIEYIYKAGGDELENPWLNKISSCVLEGISIDYGPTGSFQSLRNGEPVITNMVLQFREIETLHQARIADGY